MDSSPQHTGDVAPPNRWRYVSSRVAIGGYSLACVGSALGGEWLFALGWLGAGLWAALAWRLERRALAAEASLAFIVRNTTAPTTHEMTVTDDEGESHVWLRVRPA